MAARARRDGALIADGSTLLLAIAAQRWLVLVQIGDGDIMGIRPDGRPLLPVPRDPSLDGRQTTSLCGSRDQVSTVTAQQLAESAMMMGRQMDARRERRAAGAADRPREEG